MRPLLILLLLFYSITPAARGVYQTPDDFIAETFSHTAPDNTVLWLRGDVKREINKILGHDYATLRVRYWGNGKRTAWVLEEIGKEKPITVGLVINENRIEKIRVLEFREIRGWEVRHAFFTDQFTNAELIPGHGLSQPIDSITGATLSVDALKRLAELALYFHSLTPYADANAAT